MHLLLPLLILGCSGAPEETGTTLATFDPAEALPGGEDGTTDVVDHTAFLQEAPGLSSAHEELFFQGYTLFAQAWLEAPASINHRDGLGPLFNTVSCTTCHVGHGRAAPADNDGGEFTGLLVRLGVPGEGAHGDAAPDPTYGLQLQDLAVDGISPEARPLLAWEEVPGTYADSTAYSLRRPTLTLADPGWGPFADDVQTSIRAANHMVGLGLLEAIPESRLGELADPDDSDGDGISGRVNQSWDPELGTAAVGRFGWKAEQPTVKSQTAGAFNGDMGLTTELFPTEDCTAAQQACLDMPSGGSPEVAPELLEQAAVFSAAIAVPRRRAPSDDTVLRGKAVFSELACDACHTPSHTTGDAGSLPELSDQQIWPYTDLLLHDMGEELADSRPVFSASGSEWRTAPLWGLGLVPVVNEHDRLLHDGRARGFAEAILWHGGEAEESREAFRSLSAQDRAALIAFLGDL